MLTPERHIEFLHTLSNKVKLPPSKCELKLKMDVKSFHFYKVLMEKDCISQNNAFQTAVNVTSNWNGMSLDQYYCFLIFSCIEGVS